MAVSRRPLPAGRSEAAASTSQRCAVELAGSRWRWRWRVAPAGGTWSRRSPPPGSKHTWRSRPTRRRRGGRKRHAKTDRSDARMLRELLQSGELPESWIPPTDVLESRERVRLYTSLVDQRRVWIQRVHAELFQHGVAVPEGQIRSTVTRDRLLSDDVDLTPAGRQRVRVGYSMLEATDVEAQALKRDLQRFGHRQRACRALVEANYGIGGLIAVAVWSELGDCRRFSRSEQVVRHSGLDVSVDASDRHRAHGYLTRQGPPTLRWALFEAAMNASHRRSPDHAYYRAVKDRHDGKLAPSRWPVSSHGAATTCCATWIPTSSTRCRPDRHRRFRRPGSPTQRHGSPPRSAPATGLPAASVLDGLLTLTRPRSPRGTSKSRLLSPTTPCSSSA